MTFVVYVGTGAFARVFDGARQNEGANMNMAMRAPVVVSAVDFVVELFGHLAHTTVALVSWSEPDDCACLRRGT